MDRERLDDWLEKAILGLVLGVLVFSTLGFGAVRTFEFLIVEGLVLGIAVLWLVRCWVNRKLRLLWPPICWAVAAFVVYALVRYFTSELEFVARNEVTRVLVYAFLFLAVLNNLHSREPSQIITLTLVFTGLFVAGYATYQFFTGSQQVWQSFTPYKGRAAGTFINPNNLCGFLEMLLPLGLAFTLTGRLPAVGRVLLGYASLVILAGIGMSLSRAGWVASGVSLLVFSLVLLRYPNYRLPAILLLVLLVAATTVFVKRVEETRGRVEEVVNDAQGENNRFGLWISTFQMWRDHPWFGVGPAHFDARFREYRTQSFQRDPDRAHNDYLNTLADWGVVGFAIVLAAWILLFVGVGKTWSYVRGGVNTLGDRKGNKFAFVLGASCGLVAILVHSFADFNMHIPSNAMLAITLMALLSGHLRSASDRYWVSGGWPLKLAVSLVLLAGIFTLGRWGWLGTREFVWLNRADQLIQFTEHGTAPYSKARLEAQEKAFAVEPHNFTNALAIADAYRIRGSPDGVTNYVDFLKQAISWYERVIQLNPHDAAAYAGMGICLDWLEEFEKSEPCFVKANELDPNSYFMNDWVGWHFVQRHEFAAALPWFERSHHLQWKIKENRMAQVYMELCERRLLEGAQPILQPGR